MDAHASELEDAIHGNVVARRIGERELERCRLEARAMVYEQELAARDARIAELEDELALRPVKAKAARS